MKIEFSDGEQCLFEDLEPGDCFRFIEMGTPFMKVWNFPKEDFDNATYAVDLEDGQLLDRVREDEKVIRLDATIVVK